MKWVKLIFLIGLLGFINPDWADERVEKRIEKILERVKSEEWFEVILDTTEDITGDGVKELVILYSDPGNRCCAGYLYLDISGDSVREIGNVLCGGDCIDTIADLDEDGIKELVFVDARALEPIEYGVCEAEAWHIFPPRIFKYDGAKLTECYGKCFKVLDIYKSKFCRDMKGGDYEFALIGICILENKTYKQCMEYLSSECDTAVINKALEWIVRPAAQLGEGPAKISELQKAYDFIKKEWFDMK